MADLEKQHEEEKNEVEDVAHARRQKINIELDFEHKLGFKNVTQHESNFKHFLMTATFKPGSKTMNIWYFCIIVIPIYHGLITPPMLAFAYDHRTLWVFNLIVDIISCLCLYLGLHMCYYNEEGILVTHPMYTARNYVRSRFFLDLISSLPLEFIFFAQHPLHPSVTPDRLHFYAFLRITRLLQFSRIPYVFSHLERDIERKVDLLRLLKYIIYITIFLFFVAGILVLVACPPAALRVSATLHEVAPTLFCYELSWTNSDVVNRLAPITEYDIFTTSIYFAALTTISVG